LITKAEEDVKREWNNSIIEKGKNRGGEHTFESATGSQFPLGLRLMRRSRKIKCI